MGSRSALAPFAPFAPFASFASFASKIVVNFIAFYRLFSIKSTTIFREPRHGLIRRLRTRLTRRCLAQKERRHRTRIEGKPGKAHAKARHHIRSIVNT